MEHALGGDAAGQEDENKKDGSELPLDLLLRSGR